MTLEEMEDLLMESTKAINISTWQFEEERG
jgi:hypothetical protein